MPKIVFFGSCYGNGLGDSLIDLKPLYALKALYPRFELIYYYHGTARALISQIRFIDKIFAFDEISLEEIRALEPEIFLATRRKSTFFRQLKKLRFKKAVVLPHFESIFSRKLTTPAPFFRRKMHISDINLKLVRAVNAAHFDANIARIDFGRIRDFLPRENAPCEAFLNSARRDFKRDFDSDFKAIIGINAFSSYSQSVAAANFYLTEWLNLALQLAQKYPQFLFVLLNFKGNAVQLNPPPRANLRVFVNEENLSALISMQSALDFFISPVTGNTHLSDILGTPSLALVRKDGVTYRMSGGGIAQNATS